jgi:hypothetical protein
MNRLRPLLGPFSCGSTKELVATQRVLGNLGTSDSRREHAAASQIVMDHSGDSRHEFDLNDAEAVSKAEERFRQLTGQGYVAAMRVRNGEARRIKAFDPTAEQTLFFPRLIGG